MSTETIDEPRTIVALLTEQGVNMGDHGQDMTKAIVIDPAETLDALVERTFPRPGRYDRDRTADLYLTIRVAVQP